MKKTMINAALALTFGFAAFGAQAATVATGDIASITAGVPALDANGNQTNVSSGSYFGMDTSGNGVISGGEKTAISQGITGLVFGVTTTAGASHSGMPTSGDTNAIDAPWGFFGNTGSVYVTTAVTGSTTAGLNMSGWTVTWNGIAAIPMGSGAWGTGFSNGVGNFSWNGLNGGAYTLDYHGTVPLGDPSGFGGVKYAVHMTGTVSTVPVPAAAWLMGSGLVGLVGVARRKKQA